MLRKQTCRQAEMRTGSGQTVFFNGYKYALEKVSDAYYPAVSVAYSSEKIWDSVKAKRIAKATEQLGINGLHFVEIESREVDFYAI